MEAFWRLEFHYSRSKLTYDCALCINFSKLCIYNLSFPCCIRIFTICPAAQNKFKTFKDVPFGELPDNEDFRAHGLRVTESISLAVATLDEQDTLTMMLKDLGAAHHSVGLDQSYFDVSLYTP